MTATTLVIDRPDALDLEDELLDFTADLLALKEYQPVLGQLFGLEVGQWENLSELLQGFPEMRNRLMELESLAKGRLRVNWLRHPETSDAYCLVLFFMESLGWDSLAVYHRSLV
jgi:hypothetical protein